MTNAGDAASSYFAAGSATPSQDGIGREAWIDGDEQEETPREQPGAGEQHDRETDQRAARSVT